MSNIYAFGMVAVEVLIATPLPLAYTTAVFSGVLPGSVPYQTVQN